MLEVTIFISYHCPIFPWGTIVGHLIRRVDGSVISKLHPDISGLPLDQLPLYGIENLTFNSHGLKS